MEKKVMFGLSLFLTLVVSILLFVLLSDEREQFNTNSCLTGCVEKGYVNGSCLWAVAAKEGTDKIGECVVPNSRDCGTKGFCGCYCEKGEDYSECNTNTDCVLYGETGDCDVGCYAKDKVPEDSSTDTCLDIAPSSCACVENRCVEG